jgi:hypothetical protein
LKLVQRAWTPSLVVEYLAPVPTESSAQSEERRGRHTAKALPSKKWQRIFCSTIVKQYRLMRFKAMKRE